MRIEYMNIDLKSSQLTFVSYEFNKRHLAADMEALDGN